MPSPSKRAAARPRWRCPARLLAGLQPRQLRRRAAAAGASTPARRTIAARVTALAAPAAAGRSTPAAIPIAAPLAARRRRRRRASCASRSSARSSARQLSIAAGSYVDGVDTPRDRHRLRRSAERLPLVVSAPRPSRGRHLRAGERDDDRRDARDHRSLARPLSRPRAGRAAAPLRVADSVARAPRTSTPNSRPATAGCCSATPPGSSIRSRAKGSSSRCAPACSPPRRSARGDSGARLRRRASATSCTTSCAAPRGFKAGFFRPRFTSLLIDALSRAPAIRDVMIDLVAGRQPYRGLKRRLLGDAGVRPAALRDAA